MFSGGIEKDLWHGMNLKNQHLLEIELALFFSRSTLIDSRVLFFCRMGRITENFCLCSSIF